MSTSTRYFMLTGLGVVAVGLAVGTLAYYGRGAALAVSVAEPAELQYIPADASIVAFANVHDVMLSDIRNRVQAIEPERREQQEFQERTGINIETDIDHVVACMLPGSSEPAGLVLIRGRFDSRRLASLSTEHGGRVESYQGRDLVIFPDQDRFAVAFLEPGLVALGDRPTLERAIDLPRAGGSVTSNESLMEMLNYVEGGSNAWAIGRFDNASSLDWLPAPVGAQASALAAFAAGSRINGGVSALVVAEARDEQAGQNLRDVLQGLVALARLQAASQPELQPLLDSLHFTGAGRNVELSFSLPSEVLEQLLRSGRRAASPQ